MNELERFNAVRDKLVAVGTAQRQLDQLEKLTYGEMMKARTAAAQAVECPSPRCKSRVGVPCRERGAGGGWVVVSNPHGVRQDLSGVNGEYSRDKMLFSMGSA